MINNSVMIRSLKRTGTTRDIVVLVSKEQTRASTRATLEAESVIVRDVPDIATIWTRGGNTLCQQKYAATTTTTNKNALDLSLSLSLSRLLSLHHTHTTKRTHAYTRTISLLL
jgi:hypothetical protein